MPYGTPTNPVAGTVITVAYAVANLLDPIRWLRQLTGNADPPGADYVAASTSTTLTAWSKISAAMMASGAAVGNIGYTPLNRAGDTASGTINFAAAARILSGDGFNHYDINTVGGLDDEFSIQNVNTGTFLKLTKTGVLTVNGDTVWTSANDGAGSGLSADNLDGLSSNEFARLNFASDFTVEPTSGGGVPLRAPAGAVVWFKQQSELTAAGVGWALCDGGGTRPDLRGRLIVVAGTTGTQTFTENTAYGSSWAHLHGVGSYTTTAAAVSGAPSATVTAGSGSAVTAGSGTHTHDVALLPMQGASAETTWLPYMHAGVYGRRA